MIFQYSAAQNQFETTRYLASYPAGHPARHPAGHHTGCLEIDHLERCFVGCLVGLGNDQLTAITANRPVTEFLR